MDRITIINDLITKYNFKSYLEIGVRNTFECFDLINCEVKDSVDPGFENHINNVKYKLTSDEFFKQLDSSSLDKDSNYKWDIIFIDGLHLSYQVERDITNSLNHLSENGIIVVHDCNPPTLHHAREDYSNHDTPAMGIWNGTVWKSFYKLRCTNPNLDMCVIDCDWGVGLIKRGSQTLCDIKNEYYEFSIFDENRELSLNLITYENFSIWLDKPFYVNKKTMNINISILIINLNTLEYTKQCVEDLLLQDVPFNLTIIDQNSTEEGTWDYLNLLFDNHLNGLFYGKINVLSVYNTGYNKPVNQVWNDFVKESNTEFICLLNNDVRLSPNFLSSSISVMDLEPSVGFVNHVTNNKNYSSWDKNLEYVIMETPYRQGWDLFFRKSNYNEIPNNLIFYFGDDYIYSKLYSSGFKGAYILNSPIIHFLSSTTPEKGRVDSGDNDRNNFNKLNLTFKDLSFNEDLCRWSPEFYEITKK